MNPAERVTLNTTIMYVKAIISIGFSLFTTRILLEVLGCSDFGLFNLVGGIITMMTLVISAMSSASQRFMAHSLTDDNPDKIKYVFNASRYLHYLISVLFVIILELSGPLLFAYILNIPAERLDTAQMIYQLMILGTFLSIINIPYDAIIISHEHMYFIALIWIAESILKFIIAYSLYFVGTDKLLIYGFMMAMLPIFSMSAKVFYSRRMFPETNIQFKEYKDISVRKDMAKYASWNLLGIVNDSIGRNQGIAIILNHFFGVVTNAAFAIAAQVNTQICYFSNTIISAITPQIFKAEGAGDRDKMIRLSFLASRLSFFILAIFAVPLLKEMPFLLKIWLKSAQPEETILYCQSLIILYLAVQFFTGLKLMVQSIGNIRTFQLITFTNMLFVFLLSTILYSKGASSYTIFYVMIISEIISNTIKLFYINYTLKLNIIKHFSVLLYRTITPVILSTIFIYTLNYYWRIENEVQEFFISVFSSIAIMIISILYLGLTHNERVLIKDKIRTKILHIN